MALLCGSKIKVLAVPVTPNDLKKPAANETR